MMAADTMEALGVPQSAFLVKVNNRKVLDGILEAVGIGGEQNAGKRLTVLRAIDKLDRLGEGGVRALLGEGRKDESGDFTKGAGLNRSQIDSILKVFGMRVSITRHNLDGSGGHSDIDTIRHLRTLFDNSRYQEGLNELTEIASLNISAGYGADTKNSPRIIIDTSVVRGLEYYTGPVYEVDLTFETKDDDGRPIRFGSVGGGGRYDGLVSRFRGEPVPATGFSIGVSRLMAALQHLGKIETKPEPGPVVVTVFDQDRIADYQKMVSALRNEGVRAELYLGSGKFGAQMKYADKRGSPCVVIQGGDEKAKGEVQIKDLILGATLSGTKDRDEYLKKQAQAQFACPEDQLVDKVREVLARHAINWGE